MQDEEFVPNDLDEGNLEMLASDLNEVMSGIQYGFDVSDATVREALPAFFAALKGIKR